MLYQLAQKYEIVVFSDDDYNFIIRAQPFVDPDGMFIANYFGKECMSWEGGANIKDLKYLNRDLRKVVVIDRSKNLAKKHGGNVIVLP